MIQELFGGYGEISAPKFPSLSASSSTPITSSTTPTTSVASTSSKGDGSNNLEKKNNDSSQNLRCPRCDSTNTKFCYYNNYNLTQPRHFCKTCRRYWTKGGALRNVPFGGGCRKNKGGSASSSNALVKAKALSTELLVNGINSEFLRTRLLGHPQPDPSSNPSLWGSSYSQGQATSHILSLLRGATHFPNPNPNPSSNSPVFSTFKTEPPITLGLDPYGNGATPLLGSSSISGFGVRGSGLVQNSNILELYQKWKSSGNYNNNYSGNESENNQGVATLGNVIGSSAPSSSSSLNSTAPKAVSVRGGGESNLLGGYGGNFSSSFSGTWSEFPTVPINGTFT